MDREKTGRFIAECGKEKGMTQALLAVGAIAVFRGVFPFRGRNAVRRLPAQTRAG